MTKQLNYKKIKFIYIYFLIMFTLLTLSVDGIAFLNTYNFYNSLKSNIEYSEVWHIDVFLWFFITNIIVTIFFVLKPINKEYVKLFYKEETTFLKRFFISFFTFILFFILYTIGSNLIISKYKEDSFNIIINKVINIKDEIENGTCLNVSDFTSIKDVSRCGNYDIPSTNIFIYGLPKNGLLTNKISYRNSTYNHYILKDFCGFILNNKELILNNFKNVNIYKDFDKCPENYTGYYIHFELK